MRRLSVFASCALLVLMGLAPFVLLGTQSGAQWLASAAESRLPLRIDGLEGTMLSGLRMKSLSYNDSNVQLEIRQLAAAVNLRCVLRSVVCVDTLALEEAALAVDARGPEAPKDDPLVFFDSLPQIELKDARVGRLSLTLPDREEVFDGLNAVGLLGARGVFVDALDVCHELACIAAKGEFRRRGEWGLDATVTLSTSLREGVEAARLVLPGVFTFVGEGAQENAVLSVASPEDPALSADLQLALGDGLSAQGLFRDVNRVVPQLQESPWLQLSGTLRARLDVRDGTLALTLEEEVTGYDNAALPLVIKLQERDATWDLVAAVLGAPDPPHLRAQGALGPLSALRPDVRFEAAGLRLPEASGFDITELAGQGRLGFLAGDAPRSWVLDLEELRFTEGARRWTLSSSLRAAQDSPLPLGAAQFSVEDAALAPRPLSFRYARTDEGEAATVASTDPVSLGQRRVDALRLSLLPGERNRLRAMLEGDIATDLDLEFAFDAAGASGRLAPFAVTGANLSVRSEDAIDLTWNQRARTLSLSAFCLRLRDGRACADSVDLGPDGDLTLELDARERYEDRFAGKTFSIEGEARGRATLAWRAWQPTLASTDLRLPYLALDPYVADATAEPVVWRDGRIQGSYTADRAELSLDLASQTLGSLEADLVREVDGLSGHVVIDNAALAALSDFLPEAAFSAGTLGADLQFAGSLETPLINGTATITGGVIGASAVDTSLEDLDVAVDFLGEEAKAEGQARLGGGSLGFEAFCCRDGQLRGTLIGSRNRLRLSNGLDLSLSPSVDIGLDPQLLTVSGSIIVHDGVFEHSGLADNGIAVSRDVVRVDAPQAPAQRFDLNLDLRALIEPGFVLRSRNLESTLAGDLRFTMPPTAPPALFGNLEVLGGELRAYGQALRLTEGSLGFVGNPLNPDLSINAEREIRSDNQRVGFRVSGTLDEPLFTLFSDPQRSNEETLSYLLRGRAPDVGVSADGTAMALSLGASAVNQSGVLSSLNSLPGLSGVSIGAEGRDEEMAATISAYVGNRLYLSYGVGIYEPINALTARLYLRSRLWLEVVSRLESSVDVYYRFDRN